ncbi:MAG TPA: DUF3859 domain-containing protein [Planctomycetes bacterium]|nr:DUF3859 domain-containing protein [Fuerstiella sp.]HIK95818.1 DUF3859 domain-containing protein [Planctomycetota bacterium]
MARRKPEIRMRTWGIYSQWDSGSKQLPKIVQVTTRVPAEVDIEFGFVVNVKGAKNQELEYCIDHPGILDDAGNRRDPFRGTVYVKTNDWDFFLGDTIWNPVDDKLGEWRLTLEMNGAAIAEKSFDVVLPTNQDSPNVTPNGSTT